MNKYFFFTIRFFVLLWIISINILTQETSFATRNCDWENPPVDTQQEAVVFHNNGITWSQFPDGLCFPSFNNYKDNYLYSEFYEDERKFLKVKSNINCSEPECYLNSVQVSVGDTIRFVGYIHNNADDNYNNNGNGPAVAHNVKTSFTHFLKQGSDYLTNPFANLSIEQRISSSNTLPTTVSDSVTISSRNGQSIQLKFIPGTARMVLPDQTDTIYTFPNNQINNLFGSGAPIGSPVYGGGNYYGCVPYVGYAAFDAIAISPPELEPPAPFITKIKNTTNTALPGSYVRYTINFGNTSDDTAITGQIKVTDALDADVYDVGSTNFTCNGCGKPSGYTTRISGDTLYWESPTSGADSGLDKNETKTITFEAKVKPTPAVQCNVDNRARLDAVDNQFDRDSNSVNNKIYCITPDITKSITSQNPNPSGSITYKLTFRNRDTENDVDGIVEIADTLDNSIFDSSKFADIGNTDTAPSGYNFTVSGNTIKWTYPNQQTSGLPRNSSRDIIFTAPIKQNPDPKCNVNNSGSIVTDKGTTYQETDSSSQINAPINCQVACASLDLTYCEPNDSRPECSDWKALPGGETDDPFFIVTTNPDFDGNIRYKTDTGNFKDDFGSVRTDFQTADKRIRFFPNFGSEAEISAVGYEDACKKRKKFACESLDPITEGFNPTPNQITELETELKPYDKDLQDNEGSMYDFYDNPSITWTTNGTGCFYRNQMNCVPHSLTTPGTKVQFKAGTGDTIIKAEENSNPRPDFPLPDHEYCDAIFRPVEQPFQCQSFTLLAPSPIYEGTYDLDDENPEDPPLLLGITSFQPSEDRDQAVFIWTTTGDNPKFFDQNGNEIVPIGNDFITRSFNVRFEGTLQAGDAIRVKEQTDTEETSCNGQASAVARPQNVCTSLQSTLEFDPMRGVYKLPTSPERDFILSMSAPADFTPNLVFNPASFSDSFDYSCDTDDNPLNICVHYKGGIQEGQSFRIEETRDQPDGVCQVPIITTGPPVNFCRNLTATGVEYDPVLQKYKLTANQPKTFNLLMDATPNFRPNLQIYPASIRGHFTSCDENLNDFNFCYNYDGRLSEGLDFNIKETGQEESEDACLAPFITTGHPVRECRRFYDVSPVSINQIQRDVDITFKIDKTNNYDINLEWLPTDADKLVFNGCNPNETECAFKYKQGLSRGDHITIKDRDPSFPSCSLDIPITGVGGPECLSLQATPDDIDQDIVNQRIDSAVSVRGNYDVDVQWLIQNPDGTNRSEQESNAYFENCQSPDKTYCFFKGGLTENHKILVQDRRSPFTCKDEVRITNEDCPGCGGEDNCNNLSAEPASFNIGEGSPEDPATIIAQISKDAGHTINIITDKPESVISRPICGGDGFNQTCVAEYYGGLGDTDSIRIYDTNDPVRCRDNIEIDTIVGPEMCTITVKDRSGNTPSYLLPNSQLYISADGTLLNELRWDVTPGAGNLTAEDGPTTLTTPFPYEMLVDTDSAGGRFKITGIPLAGKGPCDFEIPIYPAEIACNSVEITPSWPNPIPITDPDYLRFIPDLNPDSLDKNKIQWFLSPQLPGNDIGDLRVDNSTKEAWIKTVNTGQPPDENGNLGYLTVLYNDPGAFCFDQRPIQAGAPPIFNDILTKNTDHNVIEMNDIENFGRDTFRYAITNELTIQPNPITEIRYVDTISQNSGFIPGKTNRGTLTGDQLVLSNNQNYTIYDSSGTAHSANSPCIFTGPGYPPCFSGSLNANANGLTINNIPANARKIEVSYNMAATDSSINFDCENNPEGVCGQYFNNKVTRKIPFIPDKSAEKTVYMFCPYLLTRNSGDVMFEKEFLYGTDVSCLYQGERNAGGISLLPQPPTPVTPTTPTGPQPFWWLTTSWIWDDPEANRIIPRFSSFLGELQTTIKEIWQKTVIELVIDENKTRSVRNYEHIPVVNPTTDLSNNSLLLLDNYNKNPNPEKRIYRFQGNLIVDSLNPSAIVQEGAKTIIIENGNLIIKKNIIYDAGFASYNDFKKMPSIAFIVQNGDIIINPNVTELHGVYVVKQGKIDAPAVSTDLFKQLLIRGSVYGNIEPLFKKRKYVGDPRIEGGAIVIRYDERIILNTPPGLEELIDLTWVKSVK